MFIGSQTNKHESVFIIDEKKEKRFKTCNGGGEDWSQKLSTADLGADHDLQCSSDKIESKCSRSTGNIF